MSLFYKIKIVKITTPHEDICYVIKKQWFGVYSGYFDHYKNRFDYFCTTVDHCMEYRSLYVFDNLKVVFKKLRMIEKGKAGFRQKVFTPTELEKELL